LDDGIELIPSNLRANGQLVRCAHFPPSDAIQRGLPADLDGAITIGIVGESADEHGLADCWGALDRKGGVPVINEGDCERIGGEGFFKTLSIGVAHKSCDALPLEGVGNGESAVDAGAKPDDAVD